MVYFCVPLFAFIFLFEIVLKRFICSSLKCPSSSIFHFCFCFDSIAVDHSLRIALERFMEDLLIAGEKPVDGYVIKLNISSKYSGVL